MAQRMDRRDEEWRIPTTILISIPIPSTDHLIGSSFVFFVFFVAESKR
jgi:hypothetical protein